MRYKAAESSTFLEKLTLFVHYLMNQVFLLMQINNLSSPGLQMLEIDLENINRSFSLPAHVIHLSCIARYLDFPIECLLS